MQSGRIAFFYIEDWQFVNEYRHDFGKRIVTYTITHI